MGFIKIYAIYLGDGCYLDREFELRATHPHAIRFFGAPDTATILIALEHAKIKYKDAEIHRVTLVSEPITPKPIHSRFEDL